MELMAVLAIGKPAEGGKSPSRKELQDMVFSERYGNKF
jgi:hypothetical protein